MGKSQSSHKKDTEFIKIADSFNENLHLQKGIQLMKGIYHQLNFLGSKSNKQIFKFIIDLNSFGQMKYIYDGEILRIENIRNLYRKPEILIQLEQIRNQQWIGQYGKQHLPFGKWRMVWRGEQQILGGSYNFNGQKEGRWEEAFEGYQDIFQVIFIGKYYQDLKRQGRWIYQQDKDRIGGSVFNCRGQKQGLWIELHENYSKNCLVKIQGEYKNNKKLGKWFYQFKISFQNKFQFITGGNYNEDGQKNGKWLDLNSDFDYNQQIAYFGDYLQGRKQGIWNTFMINDRQQYQIIGCGIYDVNQLENGYWLQLSKNQTKFNYQIHRIGQYVNGRKIGIWYTLIGNQIVGTGTYNQAGQKNGMWTHFPINFQPENIDLKINQIQGKLVTFVGKYKNGLKQGKWIQKKGKSIKGNGEYNNEGLKNGIWVELWNFKISFSVILLGEYQKGINLGQWDILIKKNKSFEKIEGGRYDDQGMKHGKWVTLHDNYNYNCQVQDVGQYRYLFISNYAIYYCKILKIFFNLK